MPDANMTDPSVPEPRALSPTPETPPLAGALMAAGLAYLGLGAILAIVFFIGGIQSSLFPTGWIFPVVLVVTGLLMTARRRFDLVAALWGGLTLAVFLLNVLIYVSGLDRGFDDAAAFDASIIVAAFGLLPLVLRPHFRS